MLPCSTSDRAGAPVPSASKAALAPCTSAREFVGLERKRRIRPAVGAAQA